LSFLCCGSKKKKVQNTDSTKSSNSSPSRFIQKGVSERIRRRMRH
jgi:hypothetical protein